jgi:hypothetical protein
LAWQVVAGVMVVANGVQTPSESEWARATAQARQLASRGPLKILVISNGGVPSAKQRRELSEVCGPQRFSLAVLTDSVMARAATTAIRLFMPNTAAFRTTEHERAFQFLGIAAAEWGNIERALATIQGLVVRGS